MTVLESDSPAHQAVLLPFDREKSARSRAATLFCPNITGLELPFFQKAEAYLQDLLNALQAEDVEGFNVARQHLVVLIKKTGEPITQWNPLILELTDPALPQGKKLPGINLTMTCLRSPVGQVSLRGADLQGAILLCAELGQADLTEVELSGADLRYADLREAVLTRAQFVQSDLSYARLSFAELGQANLYCAKLCGTVAKQANFADANLRKADARNADFYQADLRQARMQQADFREANLFMANLAGAKLRHADFRKAHLAFCAFREARMQHIRLGGANCTSADFGGADLQQCRLSGVLLNRAALTRTNLVHADLQDADLSTCTDLETAGLQGAVYNRETVLPKGFKPKKHAMINLQACGLRKLARFVSAVFAGKREIPGRFAH